MSEEKLKRNDFIKVEYTGKIKDGAVFDTNVKEEAEKLNPDAKVKPLIICLGQNMILPAIDEFLIGKETGKKYKLELTADKAFGPRRRDLIKIMPLSVFRKQNVTPQAGMVFTFDNVMGKISAVSGGRVIVDFNNPVAGKDVLYEINVKEKITELDEKVKALMQAFFKKEFKFEVKDKKLTIEAEANLKKFLEIFKPKFKEILELDSEVKETEKADTEKLSK